MNIKRFCPSDNDTYLVFNRNQREITCVVEGTRFFGTSSGSDWLGIRTSNDKFPGFLERLQANTQAIYTLASPRLLEILKSHGITLLRDPETQRSSIKLSIPVSPDHAKTQQDIFARLLAVLNADHSNGFWLNRTCFFNDLYRELLEESQLLERSHASKAGPSGPERSFGVA